MALETLCHPDEVAKRLYGQFCLIRTNRVGLRHGYRYQQAHPVAILDFIRWWKVASPMGRAADHAEGSPVQRVALVQNLDHLRR
jgi:hypothetical protein